MITGKDNVIAFIRFNNATFWRIHRSEKTQIIFDSGDKNLTLDESITRLNEAFKVLGAGTYFMVAWETEGQKKGWFSDTIQILPENLQAAYVGAINQPSVDVAGEIQKGITDYMLKTKLEAIESENKALKAERDQLIKDSDSAFNRIFERLSPHLGNIIDMITPAQQAATAVTSIGSTGDKDQERLEKAFEIWQKNETDVVTMVEKIAALSATDKSTYGMARTMLTSK